MRSLLEPHANELIEKLVALAKAGEPTALRLCVERLIPRVKPDSGIALDLPEGGIDEARNKLEIIHSITEAVFSGQMTVDDAQKFNHFLDSQKRHIGSAVRDIEHEEKMKYWEEKRLAEEMKSEDVPK